jgi:galactose-3-O-sulfotransferase
MTTTSLEYTLTDADQLCFIHLPKAGGTTLNAFLYGHFGPDEICDIPVWKDLPQQPPDLTRPRFLTGHTYYELFRLLPRNPVFITMLRDPIERSISHFEQLRRVPDHAFWKHDWMLKDPQVLSLEEFIEIPETREWVTNLQTRYIAAQFEPEIRTLQDVSSSKEQFHLLDVERAKNRLTEFVFVGLLEEFDRSMHLLSYTFGWPLVKIQSLNVSPARMQREDIAPATLDALIALNELDLELYAFAQRLFKERYQQMVNALLDTNYERRYRKDHPPVSDIMFDLHSLRVPITGWYRSETDGTVKWRWTGPGTVSTIDLPRLKDPEQCELLIKFSIVNVPAIDILESLRLEVNGRPVNLRFQKGRRGTIHVEGKAPSAALVGDIDYIRLAFHVDRTASAQLLNPGSEDHRQLGLAFGEVNIQVQRKAILQRVSSVFSRGNE